MKKRAIRAVNLYTGTLGAAISAGQMSATSFSIVWNTANSFFIPEGTYQMYLVIDYGLPTQDVLTVNKVSSGGGQNVLVDFNHRTNSAVAHAIGAKVEIRNLAECVNDLALQVDANSILFNIDDPLSITVYPPRISFNTFVSPQYSTVTLKDGLSNTTANLVYMSVEFGYANYSEFPEVRVTTKGAQIKGIPLYEIETANGSIVSVTDVYVNTIYQNGAVQQYGHTIQDATTTFPVEPFLKFNGATIVNNSLTDSTDVTIPGESFGEYVMTGTATYDITTITVGQNFMIWPFNFTPRIVEIYMVYDGKNKLCTDNSLPQFAQAASHMIFTRQDNGSGIEVMSRQWAYMYTYKESYAPANPQLNFTITGGIDLTTTATSGIASLGQYFTFKPVSFSNGVFTFTCSSKHPQIGTSAIYTGNITFFAVAIK